MVKLAYLGYKVKAISNATHDRGHYEPVSPVSLRDFWRRRLLPWVLLIATTVRRRRLSCYLLLLRRIYGVAAWSISSGASECCVNLLLGQVLGLEEGYPVFNRRC